MRNTWCYCSAGSRFFPFGPHGVGSACSTRHCAGSLVSPADEYTRNPPVRLSLGSAAPPRTTIPLLVLGNRNPCAGTAAWPRNGGRGDSSPQEQSIMRKSTAVLCPGESLVWLKKNSPRGLRFGTCLRMYRNRSLNLCSAWSSQASFHATPLSLPLPRGRAAAIRSRSTHACVALLAFLSALLFLVCPTQGSGHRCLRERLAALPPLDRSCGRDEKAGVYAYIYTFCCMHVERFKGSTRRFCPVSDLGVPTLCTGQGACKQESFVQEYEGHIPANTNRIGLRHKDVCLDRGPCTNPIHSPTLNNGDEIRS